MTLKPGPSIARVVQPLERFDHGVTARMVELSDGSARVETWDGRKWVVMRQVRQATPRTSASAPRT
jgi:hypothetical protein